MESCTIKVSRINPKNIDLERTHIPHDELLVCFGISLGTGKSEMNTITTQ